MLLKNQPWIPDLVLRILLGSWPASRAGSSSTSTCSAWVTRSSLGRWSRGTSQRATALTPGSSTSSTLLPCLKPWLAHVCKLEVCPKLSLSGKTEEANTIRNVFPGTKFYMNMSIWDARARPISIWDARGTYMQVQGSYLL